MKSVPARLKILVALILASAGLAVSDESLWIDEAQTAYKATQPDLRSLHAALEEDGGSDLSMPFYMASMWLWDKAVGARPEWRLRASNLLWYAALQCSLFAALRSWPRLAFSTMLAAAISPFVWFYMNEARPYLMQLAGAALVTGFFVRRHGGAAVGIGWTCAFAAGLLVLAGSSMLGVLWVGAALALLAWQLWRGELALGRAERTVLGGALVLLAVLGGFFFRNVFFVHNAAPARGETGLRNVAFAIYELLGTSGLGPSRAAIREAGLGAFKPFLAPVALSGAIMGGLVVAGAAAFWRENRRAFPPLAAAWGAPCAALVALGYLTHVRVLGRHFTPALPVLLLLSAWMLARLWMRPRGRIVAVAAVLLCLASAGTFRFAGRHAKDDCRAALATVPALLAAGNEVWWVNDQRLLDYYGVPWHKRGASEPGALYLRSPAAETIQELAAPDAVFLSRPDVFDELGDVRAWLAAAQYVPSQHWQGLTLWRKPR